MDHHHDQSHDQLEDYDDYEGYEYEDENNSNYDLEEHYHNLNVLDPYAQL